MVGTSVLNRFLASMAIEMMGESSGPTLIHPIHPTEIWGQTPGIHSRLCGVCTSLRHDAGAGHRQPTFGMGHN
jgi:hypothetical protein